MGFHTGSTGSKVETDGKTSRSLDLIQALIFHIFIFSKRETLFNMMHLIIRKSYDNGHIFKSFSKYY